MLAVQLPSAESNGLNHQSESSQKRIIRETLILVTSGPQKVITIASDHSDPIQRRKNRKCQKELLTRMPPAAYEEFREIASMAASAVVILLQNSLTENLDCPGSFLR